MMKRINFDVKIRMKMRPIAVLFVSTGLLVMAGCRSNRYDIKPSGAKAVVSIDRLEEDLFGSDPQDIIPSVDRLAEEYGEFLRLFGYVINIGEPGNDSWNEGLLSFATDRQNREVYLEVKKKFSSLESLEKSLSGAWTMYNHYFPGAGVPRIYSFVSGFNNSMVVGDSIMGIGLDRYLGEGCSYYPMLGIYNYQVKKMVPEKIPSDCIYAWAASTWLLNEEQEGGNTLLASMMHEGKLLYFTRCMLPFEPDSLLFGFTASQVEFCSNNEAQMWDYLVEYDLLFNTDPFTIRKFTGEAPFTTAFTNESPGRAATWLAFRIIEKYMERNQQVTLADLMADENYRQILEKARYSPR
ncbi:MAG: hypothetical protein R2744_12440 [Bacteroidales bacterium]